MIPRTPAIIAALAAAVILWVASCGGMAGGGGPAGSGAPHGSGAGAGAASEPGAGAASEPGGAGARPSEGGASEGALHHEPDPLAALGLTPYPEDVPYGPLPPNEAGQVMILLYHRIDPENRDPRWTRTPDGLRSDLEDLYDRGYRPVNAADLVEGPIDVPKGYTPVVLTFDDSTEGQFRILPAQDGSDKPPSTLREAIARIDPDSAVGILVAFHEEHPDWRLRATFYVNAGDNPFGQPEYAALKLRILKELGFEIGNHTLNHRNLKDLDADATRTQVGENQAKVAELLPGYAMRTLALPYGGLPAAPDAARRGEYEGTPYENEAYLLVGSSPAPSPYLKSFDPFKLPRVQVVDPVLQTAYTFPYTWLAQFDRHPEKRFVSDGDPLTVTIPRDDADRVRAGTGNVVWMDESR